MRCLHPSQRSQLFPVQDGGVCRGCQGIGSSLTPRAAQGLGSTLSTLEGPNKMVPRPGQLVSLPRDHTLRVHSWGGVTNTGCPAHALLQPDVSRKKKKKAALQMRILPPAMFLQCPLLTKLKYSAHCKGEMLRLWPIVSEQVVKGEFETEK